MSTSVWAPVITVCVCRNRPHPKHILTHTKQSIQTVRGVGNAVCVRLSARSIDSGLWRGRTKPPLWTITLLSEGLGNALKGVGETQRVSLS
ncbi:hypothetical protein DdX_04176 [Ditylenchus destructor]|uniref:Uncharacterized protein n=1 Tax=Ditylenchus destructor TaxID=166010 RepID=A0AAD4NE26_9BILA|nr:hypothetical protein DdX_04176 [Ditylenchus destructor]